ncbi:MAG: tetratricopeptide repeat protein [Lentisphaeraceae bacterium]|nr:tetratricopeptide repeat protein [Lentisphaeraceae bacterium]
MSKVLSHAFIILFTIVVLSYSAFEKYPPQNFSDLWQTRNQQGLKALNTGEYKKAAALFKNPMYRGIALYKDAQFEAAAMSFNQLGTAEGFFNSGNAILMMGKYELAMETYDRCLDVDPNFEDAKFNREIARLRQEANDNAKDKDNKGTGGKLGADEIVFDEKNQAGDTQDTDESTSGNEVMNDAEISELWLRRVQTKPKDFLRLKFSYQLQKLEAQK